MKRATFIVLVSLATSIQAQWVVYDPALHTQNIINSVQEIAKFVEVINNQVSQIQQLTEQVETLHHYVDLFGDPAKIVPASVGALSADLKKTELGQTLTDLQRAADATTAMLDSGAGLYHVIGKDFVTPEGKRISRQKEPYRPIAAIQKTAANYLEVSRDAAARRIALKAEVARTTDALKAAKTDAEVQKLTGVLTGLTAALESTDHEVAQATASAVVQDIANRADEQRQTEARKEQQHAEFTEALDKYGKTFRLMNAPVSFPTR